MRIYPSYEGLSLASGLDHSDNSRTIFKSYGKAFILRSIFVLIFICFMSSVSTPALAFSRGNLQFFPIESSGDVPIQISEKYDGTIYTPECLSDCHLPILFRWTGSDMTLQKSDLSAFKSQIKGLDQMGSIKIRYLDNVTFQKWITDIRCTDLAVLPNGTTPQSCSDRGHYVTDWRLEWKDVPATIPIKTNKWYIVDIYGSRKASIISNGLDVVPVIGSANLTELAWWSSSWTSRANFTLYSSVGTAENVKWNYTLNTYNYIQAGLMKSDCSDLRLTNNSDIEVSFYLDGGICGNSSSNTNSSLRFTQVTNSSSSNNTLMWIYFNNPAANDGQNKAGALDANTLGSWDMSDGSGTNIDEGSATAVDMTMTGTAGWGPGVIGNASFFDGATGYAITSGTYGSGLTAWTISFWANPSNMSALGAIAGKGESNTIREFFILKKNFAPCNNLLSGYVTSSGSGEVFTCFNELTIGTWKYYTLVYNGTHTITYLNGSYVSADAVTGFNTFTAKFMIGKFSQNANYYGGGIDELTYSNNARSANYIKLEYDISSKSGMTSALGVTQTYGTGGTIVSATNLTIDGTRANHSYSFNSSRVINITGMSNVTGAYVAIYQNGTLKANSTTSASWSNIFPVGLFNLTAVTQSNSSMSGSSETFWLNISKNSNDLYWSINNGTATYGGYVGGSPCGSYGTDIITTYGTPINISGYVPSMNGTMWMDSTNITSSLNQFIIWPATASFYTIRFNTTGTMQNYSYNCSQNALYINKADPGVSVTFNTTSSVVQGTPINISCSPPGSNLYNDTGAMSNPSVITASSLGVFNYTCNITTSQNYTAGSATKQLLVTASANMAIYVFDESSGSPMNFNITISNSTNFRTDLDQSNPFIGNTIMGNLIMSASASGFSTRNYYTYFSQAESQNITLYLLHDSLADQVKFSVLDATNTPVQGIYIRAKKEAVAGLSYQQVAETISDFEGNGYMWLELNKIYVFDLVRDGVVIRSFSPMTLANTEVIFHISTSTMPEYFSYIHNVASDCDLDNVTYLLTCSWNDTSSLNSTMNFRVTQHTIAGDLLLCNNLTSADSGSFQCDLAGNSSYSYELVGTYYSSPKNFLWQAGEISTILSQNLFGGMGILLAFLICGMLPLMVLYDVRIALIMNVVGQVICLFIGLIYGGTQTATLMILAAAVSGLVVYKIKT